MCNRCLIKETKKLKCIEFHKKYRNQYKGNKGHRLASCGYEAFSMVRLHILVTTLSWRATAALEADALTLEPAGKPRKWQSLDSNLRLQREIKQSRLSHTGTFL